MDLSQVIRLFHVALCVPTLVFLLLGISPAEARRDAHKFAASLNKEERQQFEQYIAHQTFHDAAVDAYWAKVNSTRKKRRAKIRKGISISKKDYVTTFPPKYNGPTLSASLKKRWQAYLAKKEKKSPSRRKSLPSVADYLAASKKYYGFVPERIPEREFKKRYAREALRVGLNKEQVVRVYALETGGNGTADMQAGIHPVSKKGRPISSALGYAQLLAANSISELVLHGNTFIRRLRAMSKQRGISEQRAQRLNAKISSLTKMLRTAKSVPNDWYKHVRLARTPRGRGIHAINIDGDIGPWLQVIKLKGIKDLATRKGRPGIASHQLELMNLAGPGTGLEMMTALGLAMPTANFFARRGYERNTIVRGRTSAQLLEALRERMDGNVKNDGAIEFNAIFDELLAAR